MPTLESNQPPRPDRKSAVEIISELGVDLLLIAVFLAGNLLLEHTTPSWWTSSFVHVVDATLLWRASVLPTINRSIPPLCSTVTLVIIDMIRLYRVVKFTLDQPPPRQGGDTGFKDVKPQTPDGAGPTGGDLLIPPAAKPEGTPELPPNA
jgi:hypothetical protein